MKAWLKEIDLGRLKLSKEVDKGAFVDRASSIPGLMFVLNSRYWWKVNCPSFACDVRI